jgi:hypothetical protein
MNLNRLINMIIVKKLILLHHRLIVSNIFIIVNQTVLEYNKELLDE